MLIKEIKNNENNDNLTYDIFIDKGINLLEKVKVIIKQYCKIKDNNKLLINKIKDKINLKNNNKDMDDYKNNDFNIENNENIIKNIMKKLYKLNNLLLNFINYFKDNTNNIYLIIQEISNILNYDSTKFLMNYEKEIKKVDVLFSSHKKIIIEDDSDNIFEHINNISNTYNLITNIILNIHAIIYLGEILKNQNIILRDIYKEKFDNNFKK